MQALLRAHVQRSATEICDALRDATPLHDHPNLAATYVVIKRAGGVE